MLVLIIPFLENNNNKYGKSIYHALVHVLYMYTHYTAYTLIQRKLFLFFHSSVCFPLTNNNRVQKSLQVFKRIFTQILMSIIICIVKCFSSITAINNFY